MRKLSTRSVLLVLLVVASICSYIYLNTVTVSSPGTSASNDPEIENVSEMDEIESEQQELVLPDVQMIKKILETGKRLIPSS